ncbi:MAG: ATP-binding protein [Pseudomonadota bacterium]
MVPDTVDDAIYIISHDLRAEMRALRELPRWIKDDIASAGHQLDADILDNIAMLINRADRLDRMMEDLLLYSRAGRAVSDRSAQVSHAFDRAKEQVGPANGFNIAARVEDATVRIAEPDLVTFFEALIQNAIVHHDRGARSVQVSAQIMRENLLIDVIDDGPGIHSKDYEKALKVMTRLSQNANNCGSGIGLPTCKKIAEQYEGNLSLAAAPNGRGLHVKAILKQRPPCGQRTD